jgi:hypothetical protein
MDVTRPRANFEMVLNHDDGEMESVIEKLSEAHSA